MSTIKEKVGERIKQIRHLQNISQEDLANSAQMSRGFISGVETGKRNITVETLGKILEVLNVSYSCRSRYRSKAVVCWRTCNIAGLFFAIAIALLYN